MSFCCTGQEHTLTYLTCNIITKGSVIMPLPQERLYTIDDIYNLPEGTRAELIDGRIYYMAPPSRKHQQILLSLSRLIADYID